MAGTLGARRLGEDRIPVRIRQARLEAEGVVSLDFEPLAGALPGWSAGAHIDVVLPSGTIRQYSLCGAVGADNFRIAVLRQENGRGGSREVHDNLRVGQVVEISAPRNTFALEPAERYFFVAGGIGITPILPMIDAAVAAGADWHLVYGGRNAWSMAFAEALRARDPERVELRTDDRDGPLDVAALCAGSAEAKVYACGPQGLLDALEAAFAEAGRASDLHLERFAAVAKALPDDGSVRVHLARSGGHVDVPPDQTILAALQAQGIAVPCSCEQGFCGTCETRVLAGAPDHRDDLLSDEERARGDVMLPCVSRAKGRELTLDL